MNLATRYLGLTLDCPLVVSACPLSRSLDLMRRLEDAGAGAIVLFSLFEEQILAERQAAFRQLETTSYAHPESLSYFPAFDPGAIGPDAYLEHIRRAREALAIPVIASLNGSSEEGWTDFARLIELAGASALELNLYHIPTDFTLDARAVEARYLRVVAAVREQVRLPLAVKIGPYFTALGNAALAFAEAGADGLVLFNRFYQPDLDIEARRVDPRLSLSRADEIRLPLRWIGLLHGRVGLSLAASSGVESVTEVVKYLLAGADVVMTASALLRHGPEYLAVLRRDLVAWLERHGYPDVATVRGSMSQAHVDDPGAYERANYIRTLESFALPDYPRPATEESR